ncbi:hypothetical protein B296_00002178 [Ensete ventricosum]|uniref:Uncharacterized protein n=1 Tax=Ensete ventricosum TaxID=4639 RepID=A0A427B300_ENSVE|nr:hypothetical protein B296_00002178 [Ensete ventricosum]
MSRVSRFHTRRLSRRGLGGGEERRMDERLQLEVREAEAAAISLSPSPYNASESPIGGCLRKRSSVCAHSFPYQCRFLEFLLEEPYGTHVRLYSGTEGV